jgi:phage replication O-like protein O
VASPQLEDGYTKIANEILENLERLYLRPNQWRVLMCVLRKTYGFNKKQDYITNSQIVIDTGLRKEVVSYSISDMVTRNILVRENKIVGFQKDWEQWKLSEQTTKESCLIRQPELSEQLTKVVCPLVTQKKKETYTKEIKKYIKKESFFPDLPGILLSKEEYDKLLKEFGVEDTRRRCEALFLYMGSHGKKYASHYMTILSWDRMEKKREPKQEETKKVQSTAEYFKAIGV